MPAYDNTLEDIKNRLDIVDFISEYISLKKAGQNWKGLCPFHAEKTPSFTVSPAKQIFHCFGCNTGGDIFSFLTRYENLTFPEALNVLAKRAGLSATLSKNATRQDLGEKKTLALVIGVSMKGLGAAGLDLEQEKTRVRELIDEANRRDIPLLCLHLGGESRRGELSDQMIQDFLPHAQMVIVVKSGNKDGLFTKICTDKKIPFLEVERTSEVQEPLKNMFAQNE